MANPQPPRRRGDLSLSLTFEERALIASKAEMYDMSDGAFARSLLLGCIAQGGGIMDKMIRLGAQRTNIQRRSGRNYETEWQRMTPVSDNDKYGHPVTWGIGPWRLSLPHRSNVGGRIRNVDKGNTDLFWHLSHIDVPEIMRPIAYSKPDACRRAIELIESWPNASPYEVLTRQLTFND